MVGYPCVLLQQHRRTREATALQRAYHGKKSNLVPRTPDMQGSPTHVVLAHMLDNDACSLGISLQVTHKMRKSRDMQLVRQY